MKANLVDLQGAIMPDGTTEQGPQFLLTNFCSMLTAEAKKYGGGLFELPPTDGVAVIEVLVLGLADAAKDMRKQEGAKERGVAVIINSLEGEPILSLKVSYEPGTEDNPEGSWEPVYVFGSDGLEGCITAEISDVSLHRYFVERANAAQWSFNNPTLIYAAAMAFAKSVYQYLDAVASPAEEMVVQHPNFFEAAVSVIDNKKVMSFTMGEEISNIIKGDTDLIA